MRKSIKYKKLRAAALAVALAAAMSLIACRPVSGYVDGGESSSAPDSGGVFFEPEKLEDWKYTPFISTNRSVQYHDGYLYFDGESLSLYKYPLGGSEAFIPCTDPICKHGGSDSACKFGTHVNGLYFYINGDMIIYEVLKMNFSNTSPDIYVYVYNTKTMENTLIDDSRQGQTWDEYTVSDDYLYFKIAIYDEKTEITTTYYRQVELSSGKAKLIFAETEIYRSCTIIGAANGKLYTIDRKTNITYVSDESDPENTKEFFGSTISNVWVGKNDMCFKAADPEATTAAEKAKTYMFRTDLNGNILSKTELPGNMIWGSICDGKYLYYIPFNDVDLYLSDGTPANYSDGSGVMKGNAREVYRMDVDTGERTLAFTFDGDYSALYMPMSKGRSFYVADGKIIISTLRGVILTEDETGEKTVEDVLYENGAVIIDMESGDITHVTSDSVTNIEMRTGKEMKAEPDGESEAESGD